MSIWRQVRHGLSVLLRRARADRDLTDEVAHYEQELTASYERHGMTPGAARRAARQEMGSTLALRDRVRTAGWEHVVSGLLDDVRYAFRRLAKQPVFMMTALLTVALGVGATAAIFAVVDGVILRPLPYPAADRLVALDHAAPGIQSTTIRMAPSLYYTYREESRLFEAFALWNGNRATVTGVGDAEEVPALFVTPEFLDVLRIPPAIGRGLTAADGEPGNPHVVLLADGYWRQRFGGAGDILRRQLQVDGVAREIIGVLPASFTFLDERISLVIPRRLRRAEEPLIAFGNDGIARLKPGVTIEQANADLLRCLPLAERKFPLNPGFAKNAFRDARIHPSLQTLRDHLVGETGRSLWVLAGAVVVLLLIACANVANLLLVRASGRERELAVREALGAGWGRLTRDLLAEALLLGLGGGVLGTGLCLLVLQWVTSGEGSHLPRVSEIGVSGGTLLFTLGVSLTASLLFGCIPVWKAVIGGRAERPLHAAGGRTVTSGRERHGIQRLLLMTQVALATVLLMAAGLLLRTYGHLRAVDPGFRDPQRVQLVRISLPAPPDPTQLMRSQQEILQRFQTVMGVEAAGITNAAPLEGGARTPVYTADHPVAEGRLPPVRFMRSITPGYAAATGARLLAGRDLTWPELYAGPPVVLISENMARELWGDPRAALGRRLRMSLVEPWSEIIGVLADLRDDGIAKPAPAMVYWPLLRQRSNAPPAASRNVEFVIRSSRAGSMAFVDELRRALREVNGSVPLANVRTLESVYRKSMARLSFLFVMLSVAGAVALALGIVGVYGVMAYTVAARRREIGIRLALGASPASVQRRFLRQGLQVAGAGAAAGLLASVVSARVMRSLLSGLAEMGVAQQAIPLAVVLLAALLACWVPVRRATRVNPCEVLRAD
ncbi:MAG: ABC transporter permease [Bryobacterales bacterium]|nr:ABC transporter permease [Bryobacterales bacterium]